MKIQNPVLTGFNPDPSICRVGDDYYIATSTFEWFPGVQIHHSKDLVNWRLLPHPLKRVSQLDMRGNPNSGGVWAPALTYADNQFWLIYSDMKVVDGAYKEGHNYLVTCQEIDGCWSEPIYLNSSGFDPSLFHDQDGRKWLVNMLWDYRLGKNSFAGIVLQEYSVTEKKLIGDIKNIYLGTHLKLTEAPHLYRINNYYYLITAEGGTSYEHAVTIARSKTIDGPYETHPDNPILTSWHDPHNYLQKCGHASIVDTPDGQWYLAHLMGRPIHQTNEELIVSGGLGGISRGRDQATQNIMGDRGYCPLGRESSIQKLEWRDGWPYVIGGKEGAKEVAAPNLVEVKFPPTHLEVDQFEEVKLNINFNTLRIPFTEKIGSLSARENHLRLYGNESLTSKFTQSLVARRWQSFNFEAETAVDFKPTTFQQSAGLVNYYNTENWTALRVTWDESLGRCLSLMTCDNFSFNQLLFPKISIPDECEYVYLRVNVHVETYQYSYSFDGRNWEKIAILLDATKLSDDYIEGGGFFTGSFVGMQCEDMSGQRAVADFKYFKYQEIN